MGNPGWDDGDVGLERSDLLKRFLRGVGLAADAHIHGRIDSALRSGWIRAAVPPVDVFLRHNAPLLSYFIGIRSSHFGS